MSDESFFAKIGVLVLGGIALIGYIWSIICYFCLH